MRRKRYEPYSRTFFLRNNLNLPRISTLSMKSRNVALVLSSGGARGYAHIGAIDALEQRGYHITSGAGTSMGALVGGLYCAGDLDKVKEWMFKLNNRQILSLIDWSLGKNHIVKGERIIDTLKTIVPDVNIEQLDIPFRAVAADLKTQREVVFSKRSLYRAIRASISIPTMIKPVKIGEHILVDGGIANPLPLNRVVRHEGDLLVSVNVSAPASESVEMVKAQSMQIKKNHSFFSRHIVSPIIPDQIDSNHVTLLASAFTLLIQRQTVLMQKLHTPDIAVDIPMNRYGVFDFHNARHITQEGFKAMNEALDAWESQESVE